MTVWNISGGANASIVNGLPSSAQNDLGTIRGAGTVASTGLFQSDAVSLGLSRNITIVSGVNGVEGAQAGGTFNGGDQVIRKVTTDLAGVSNNALLTGASNSATLNKSINQRAAHSNYYYKTAVRTGGWHEFSGVFSPAVSVGATGFWSQATDSEVSSALVSSGVDNAANPTASVPGELVYRRGGPNPYQDDYKAKTSY